ncbi:MAG: hypothetical protein GY835_21835 [bacterium]|nr:hypothetical protein [bacterium]
MEHNIKIAREQLEAAIKLGLTSNPNEIEILLNRLDAAILESADHQRKLFALQNAFDILQGVVADQTSRINALENAIRDYLDPDCARNGVMVLETVLEKELGEEVELFPA